MRRNILDTYMILGGVLCYWKFLQREYTNLRWMTCLHFDTPRMVPYYYQFLFGTFCGLSGALSYLRAM